MVINYGLLDSTIPAQLGALPGNALAAYFQRRREAEDRAMANERMSTQNALVNLNLKRGQREMDEEDAYRKVLAGIQNGNYEAAMPDLMRASPARALELKKNLADEQKSGLETTLKRFEFIDRVAAQFAANPTRQTGVWVLSQLAASGTPPEVIQEMSAKLNAARDEDLPKMSQAFLMATREGAKAQIEALAPKPAAPTNLARLIAEREAAAAKGDAAAVAAYDQAIQRETTHSPSQVTPYYQFLQTAEGYLAGDTRTGQAAPVVVSGKSPLPATADPTLQGKITAERARGKTTAETQAKRERSAVNAVAVLDEADQWIDKATSSYAGAARDMAVRAVGASTQASQAAARLRVLQGALMMAQPRMEGQQSNLDLKLYQEMAARIGDPTVPAADKKAAVKTLRNLHAKYLPQNSGAPAAPGPGVPGARTTAPAHQEAAPDGSGGVAPTAPPAGMDNMPPPAEHTGRIIRDSATGLRYRSDGQRWVRVP